LTYKEGLVLAAIEVFARGLSITFVWLIVIVNDRLGFEECCFSSAQSMVWMTDFVLSIRSNRIY